MKQTHDGDLPKIDRRRTVTAPGEPASMGNPRFTVRAPRGLVYDWIKSHGGPSYLIGLAVADMATQTTDKTPRSGRLH